MKALPSQTFMILFIIVLLASCQSNSETNRGKAEVAASGPSSEMTDDDYTDDSQNKIYHLGTVTFRAKDTTYTIDQFGLDPYSVIRWFTEESGITPMAGAVLKSDDFVRHVNITVTGLDTMQENISGTLDVAGSGNIAAFVAGDENYMFSEGTIEIHEFSRKTGQIKVVVEGKCNYTKMFDPGALEQGVDAILEIDAVLPGAVVDGVISGTDAARQFNLD